MNPDSPLDPCGHAARVFVARGGEKEANVGHGADGNDCVCAAKRDCHGTRHHPRLPRPSRRAPEVLHLLPYEGGINAWAGDGRTYIHQNAHRASPTIIDDDRRQPSPLLTSLYLNLLWRRRRHYCTSFQQGRIILPATLKQTAPWVTAKDEQEAAAMPSYLGARTAKPL